MLRLWCWMRGHRLLRPKAGKGRGRNREGYYTHCVRCKTLMVRDYYDGWQPASQHERRIYARLFGPEAQLRAPDSPPE
jgi:hypothetical protein